MKLTESPLRKQRDPYFDSLKFILTAMVVMGHALQAHLESGNRLLFTTYAFTQIFRIPLFIFVSGYFTKNLTWEKYKKGLLALVVMYFLFQLIYSFDNILAGRFSFLSFLLEPTGPMWYIMALILWRAFFSLKPTFKYEFPIILTLSLLASLVIGFKITLLVHEAVRVVSFFPYFVLGYYCSPKIIEKIRSWNGFIPLFILILGFIAVYDYMPSMFRMSLYGTFSFKVLFREEPLVGLLHRVLSFPLAIFFGVMVLNLCTDSFARWGKKTVYIYLLHPIIMFSIYFGMLDWFGIEQTFFGNMLAFPIVVIVCVYISRFQVIQFLVNPVNFIKDKRKKTRDE